MSLESSCSSHRTAFSQFRSENKRNRPPCHDCAPSLLSPEGNGDLFFEPASALTLAALGNDADEDWTGRWSLSAEEKNDLLYEIEKFSGDPEAGKSQPSTKPGNFFNIADQFARFRAWSSSTPTRDISVDASLEGRSIRGKIKLEHLEGYIGKEDNRNFVKLMPNAVHGILNEQMRRECFDVFDKDKDQTLDKSEWSNYLERLAFLHLKYLLCEAMLDFRAFFGRGQHAWQLNPSDNTMEKLKEVLRKLAQENLTANPMITRTFAAERAKSIVNGEDYSKLPSEDLHSVEDNSEELSTFQVGFDYDGTLPEGWWDDLYYYSANNHPLHGIVACDKFHPLSWYERLAMEFATFGLAFFTLWLHDRWVGHAGEAILPALSNPIVFSLVVVTIPGIVLWWTLFLLFTCRCFLVNPANSTSEEVAASRRKTLASESVGFMLVLLGIAFFIYGVGDLRKWLVPVLLGRAKSYIIAWMMMIFVYFNPLIAWGQPNPTGDFCAGDLIGLGQWRIEKQRFQAMCVKGITAIEDYEDHVERRKSSASNISYPKPKKRSFFRRMLPRLRPKFPKPLTWISGLRKRSASASPKIVNRE